MKYIYNKIKCRIPGNVSGLNVILLDNEIFSETTFSKFKLKPKHPVAVIVSTLYCKSESSHSNKEHNTGPPVEGGLGGL